MYIPSPHDKGFFLVGQMVHPPQRVQQGTPRPSVESKCSAKACICAGGERLYIYMWSCMWIVLHACCHRVITFFSLLAGARPVSSARSSPRNHWLHTSPGGLGISVRDSSEGDNTWIWNFTGWKIKINYSCPSCMSSLRHPPQVHDHSSTNTWPKHLIFRVFHRRHRAMGTSCLGARHGHIQKQQNPCGMLVGFLGRCLGLGFGLRHFGNQGFSHWQLPTCKQTQPLPPIG